MSANRPKKPPVIPMDSPYSAGAAPPPRPQLPLPPPPIATPKPADDFDAGRALLRLLVGTAVLGVDELQRRLRAWEQAAAAVPPARQPEDVDQAELVRYAFIGLIFEAHDQARKRIDELLDNTVNAAGATLARLEPLLNSSALRPLAEPLLQQLDEWVERGAERTAQLARRGLREEQRSRLLAERVYAQALDDFIHHLSENEELVALIQAKGATLASMAQNRFRQTTADLDLAVETVFRRLLGRRPRRDLPRSPLSGVLTDELDG